MKPINKSVGIARSKNHIEKVLGTGSKGPTNIWPGIKGPADLPMPGEKLRCLPVTTEILLEENMLEVSHLTEAIRTITINQLVMWIGGSKMVTCLT